MQYLCVIYCRFIAVFYVRAATFTIRRCGARLQRPDVTSAANVVWSIN